MNVLVTNKQEELLSELSIEVMKALRGEYDVEEIIGQFSNFFFGRMIFDVTAMKDYKDIVNYQKISIALPVDKIILLLPSDIDSNDPGFISKLISIGFYNFGKTLDEIIYLLNNPNNYKDVAHLHKLEPDPIIIEQAPVVVNQASKVQQIEVPAVQAVPVIRVLGIKNVTSNAGATTLAYLMRRELETIYGISALAIEVNKRDFVYFNDNKLMSVNKNDLPRTIMNAGNYRVVIVDLNDADPSVCDDVLYLVEPSILKLNKLLRLDSKAFNKLKGKKILLNKTLVSGGNIDTFEYETGVEVYGVIKPLDDRSSKPMLGELLSKLGFIDK